MLRLSALTGVLCMGLLAPATAFAVSASPPVFQPYGGLARTVDQVLETLPPEEAEDLRRLAADTGSSLDAVVRKHGNAAERSRLLGVVERSFSTSFSGASVADDGTLRLYFVGARSPQHDQIDAKPSPSVRVAMNFGRAMTQSEWNDKVGPELAGQLRAAGILAHSSRYDHVTDVVEVRVPSRMSERAKQALGGDLAGKGLAVTVVSDDGSVARPETTVVGGSHLGSCTGGSRCSVEATGAW